jgi:excisionase family DNA binding protein
MIRLSAQTSASIALHATNSDWVAFVQCQPAVGIWPIKIEGIRGKRLVDRLSRLANDNPFDVFLVGLIESRQLDLAQILKAEFATDNIHDDWFMPSQVLISLIEQEAQASVQALLVITQPGSLPNDAVVSIEEIAELLDVSVPTVRRLVKADQIPHLRYGRALRFVPEDVLATFKR